MKGYIHSFESLAAVDGEGLRCAVFLAGCILRCAYCHNPDTWYKGGYETDAQTLVSKLSRYKPYFKTVGGVTFSGGEPLLQAEFISECVPLLEKNGINYIIDTSGAVEMTDTVKYVLSNSQLVLLDLKFWDEESYFKYTNHGINRTLDMLNYLDSIGKRVWLRTVIVPGINDTEEIIQKYFPYVKKCVERYELLAFHTMGFQKYEKLGQANPFIDKKDLDLEVRDTLQRFVDKSVFGK